MLVRLPWLPYPVVSVIWSFLSNLGGPNVDHISGTECIGIKKFLSLHGANAESKWSAALSSATFDSDKKFGPVSLGAKIFAALMKRNVEADRPCGRGRPAMQTILSRMREGEKCQAGWVKFALTPLSFAKPTCHFSPSKLDGMYIGCLHREGRGYLKSRCSKEAL